ncbi:MAG: amidohydrolase [Actinobacteria bacterium]|nr:amidohydrolase [Actinomycetota bacterium]
MGTWKKAFDQLRMSERMPVDVMPSSNGERIPPPPTPEQRRIMAIQDHRAEEVRHALGMTRRDFVRSSAAYGVGFWAINQVMPGGFGRYLNRADDDPWQPSKTDACNLEFPDAQLNNLPGEFIFDVQSHHVDPAGTWRVTNPGFHAVFAALWEQAGPLGGWPGAENDEVHGWGEGGEFDPIQNLSRYHYLKELFLDSSTNMTVLSAVPSAPDIQNPLRISEAAETVGLIKALAGGTDRSVMHAFVMPNRGSTGTGSSSLGARPAFMQEEFDFMEETLRRWGDRFRGWKVYTPWGDVPNSSGWYLDDAVGQPFFEQVRHLGDKYGVPKVIACHKGFALPSFDARASSPRDVGPAAKANPDVTIIVYHSGYDSEKQEAYPGDENWNSSDRGVNSLVKSLRENQYDATRFVQPGLQHGNVPNVYAEIGAVMSSVMSDPDQLAHLLGKLITYVGPQRIAWGTDSLWFGSPQPVIAGLRAFEFSDQAKEFYNLPYGLDGDRFDPLRNAMSGASYLGPHPAGIDWPTDGRAHPERSIRNGLFGRNAAVPYRVDPDAQLEALVCDEVQKIRDGYILNEGTPRESAPMATNFMPAPRTPEQLWELEASEPWGP